MTIDLTAPLNLPADFQSKLRSIDSLCLKMEFSEELVEQPLVKQLVYEINSYCENNKILGFHYTRANIESIREHGLLLRTGDEIRSKFIEDYSSIFSEDEINELEARWKKYYSGMQKTSRDLKIFFNFTLSALNTRGSENLLGKYGGEQIMMCFDLKCNFGKKLASLGTPMVVHCSLDPKNIRTYISEPWGKIMVSSYHKQLNESAFIIDQDGMQNKPVLAKDIIKINALTIASS